jgi:hypothetical protein
VIAGVRVIVLRPDKITTGKKNVQSSGRLCFSAGSNYNRKKLRPEKKGIVLSSGRQLETGKNYVRKKGTIQSSGRRLEHKTQNTTQTNTTTNKMSRATLYPPTALPPLSPWVE